MQHRYLSIILIAILARSVLATSVAIEDTPGCSCAGVRFFPRKPIVGRNFEATIVSRRTARSLCEPLFATSAGELAICILEARREKKKKHLDGVVTVVGVAARVSLLLFIVDKRRRPARIIARDREISRRQRRRVAQRAACECVCTRCKNGKMAGARRIVARRVERTERAEGKINISSAECRKATLTARGTHCFRCRKEASLRLLRPASPSCSGFLSALIYLKASNQSCHLCAPAAQRGGNAAPK